MLSTPRSVQSIAQTEAVVTVIAVGLRVIAEVMTRVVATLVVVSHPLPQPQARAQRQAEVQSIAPLGLMISWSTILMEAFSGPNLDGAFRVAPG